MIPRGTQAWREAHRGKISASDAQSLLARVGTRRRAELIERVARNVLDGEGTETEEFPAPWTVEHEAELKAAMVAYRAWAPDETVVDGGLVVHPSFEWLVASPHLLVDADGCVLLRPRSTLKSYHAQRGKLSRAYRVRVQLTLFVTQRAWCRVADYWNGAGLAPDRLHALRVEQDSQWLLEHVFPPLVALWKDIQAASATRSPC